MAVINTLQDIIPSFFVGENGQRLTPEQIAQRQKVAQSLLGRATDTSPDAGGWASILTKGLLGYKAGADQRAADEAIAQNAAQSSADIAALLGGGAGYSAPVAAGASPTSAAATGTSTSVAVPEGEMAGVIRQGLTDRGLPAHLADAAILNFQDESGLNPGINEQNPIVAGSRGGYGLYQLTGPRRREYEAFAAQRGVDPSNVDAQLDFFMNELNGSEAAAGKKFLAAPDTASGAQILVNDFLRPAEEHRKSRSAKYAGAANTPQEAIEIVSPQSADPAMSSSFNDRWNAGAAAQEVAPAPSPAVANALVSPQSSGPSEALLAQNDMALGGALSPSGTSPVAQALSGYFPDAPSAAPSQGNSQTATIARVLGDPYASNEAKQLAMGMYQQQQAAQQQQQKLAMEAQQQQQMIAQRQNTAGALGINPALAGADDTSWKAAVEQATRNRNTVTVGNTVYDANTGQPIIQGATERFQTVTGDQAKQLGLDPSKAYNVGPDGKISSIGDNGVTVNVGGGDEANKEFAKLDAKALADVSSTGMSAQRNLSRLDQLETLLKQSPNGFAALAAQRAGEWGINTEGLDSIQAAQALISSLVPEQRAPGSGPMSDADLDLYKQSIPRIINTPGGNESIIRTMRAVAQYDAQGAEIVQKYRNGDITRAQAFKELHGRVNPLASFKESTRSSQSSGQVVPASTSSNSGGWRDVGNGVKIRAKQ